MKFNNVINIDRFIIGSFYPCFLIAEAGVAHFGSLENAIKLVDMAVEAETDAVKFQVFKTENLISKCSQEWIDRLKSKELSYSDIERVRGYCEAQGILFLATPHEEESADFLDDIGIPAYKVGSGEVGNVSFIKHLARKGKPIMISTGLHNPDDIELMLDACMEEGNANVALFHCITAYPTPVDQSNLNAIQWMRERFSVPVGYSDHTVGDLVPIAAVAMGAKLLEKHICLDKNVEGSQDCKVSCDRTDLIKMVKHVRLIEEAAGTNEKKLTEAAETSIPWARKSVVIVKSLKAGSVLNKDDLCLKRPGTGILPNEINKVVGKTLVRNMEIDDVLQWEDLK